MPRTATTALAAAVVGAFGLAGCGGAGGLSTPDDGPGSGSGPTTLVSSWAPSDSDWYLYGAKSMAVIEESSNLDVTVQESAGSEENAIRMDQGRVDVGMIDVQGAQGALGEHDLTTLYPISVVLWQLIAAEDAGISDVADLDGKKWNPGPIGGGSTDVTKQVLKGMGITPDYHEATLSDAVSAYTGRQTVGFSYRGAGVQATGAVLEAASARPISLVSLTDAQIEKAKQANPDLVPVTIPGGTYQDVPEDVQTFGYWGVVVGARGDLDEAAAYEMTKTFWENIGEIKAQLPQTEGLTPERAVEELVLPLHPGAARYYEEVGVEIPEEMVA